MLIACVQSDVTFANPKANLSRVLAWMEKAADTKATAGEGTAVHATQSALTGQTKVPASDQFGADLLVFPECMLTGYAFEDGAQAMDAALSIDDTVFQQIAAAAARHQQWISIGFVEKADGSLFNSAALVGPGGVFSCYRKIHLPHLGVDRFVQRGDRPYEAVTAETKRGSVNIGLAICYDGSFPEPIRVLALSGAEIIALGTNWPTDANRVHDIVPPARSMENHVYFAAANRVGEENGFTFSGCSSICGPDGVILARSTDDREALVVAHVDLEIARTKRIVRTQQTHSIDRFADRRPEFYGRIVQPTGKGESESQGFPTSENFS